MKKMMTMLLAAVMVFAMMLPVAAAKSDFVPSAEVKPAPDVVEKPTEDGTPAVGEIVMPDGTVIPVPGTTIIITPLEGADDAEKPTTTDALKEAYQDLLDAEDLSEVIPDLDKILEDLGEDVDKDDLVISDLFHVDLDEYQDQLDEGGKFRVTFEVDGDILFAMILVDGEWVPITGENFIDNGDGTYTLLLSQSGVVAFVKNAASVDVDPEDPGVSSPTTGDMSMLYVVMGSVLLFAAVAFAAAAKKQKA